MSERVELKTGTDDLQAFREDGVMVLTLNRPERRNAFSGAMLAALAKMLDEAERDTEVGAVLLTGAGKAFSAGGDVKGMNQRNTEGDDGGAGGSAGGGGGGIDHAIHLQRLSQRATSGRLYNMPKPTLAALPGAAAGAGLALALACDLRMAADSAFMVTAFARVGFSGDYGGTYFLSQLVGGAKARELYLLSERVPAQDAERLGLVNWVVPAAELEKKSLELAKRLAAGPRIAYRYIKENINRALEGGEMVDCLDLEVTHHTHCGLTEDHKEAVRAFVEKREPTFKGR